MSDFLSKIVQANNCMSGIIVYWNAFVNLKLIVKQIINYRNLGGRNWASTESLGWDVRNYRNLGVGTEQLQEPLGGTWIITGTLGWDLNHYMIFGDGKWTITGTLGWDQSHYMNFGDGSWGFVSTTKWPLNPGYCLNLLYACFSC